MGFTPKSLQMKLIIFQISCSSEFLLWQMCEQPPVEEEPPSPGVVSGSTTGEVVTVIIAKLSPAGIV